MLCKLTVSGSLRPPFIRVLPWQPRHPPRQNCWGSQLWGDTHPVPLVERDVFSNLGRGAPRTRERGRGGAGGGVPLRTHPPTPRPRMLQQPDYSSCFNFVKSELRAWSWFSGNAGSLVHALATHLWSAPVVYAVTMRMPKIQRRKQPGLLPVSGGAGRSREKTAPAKLYGQRFRGSGWAPCLSEGVGTASSKKGEREVKKGETELVIRCVAGGQDAWEGWQDIRQYPRVGWVQPRMDLECSLRPLLQTAGLPEEP